MKKSLILSMVLILAACETTVLFTKDAQDFANSLEAGKDPVEVIEAYDMYKNLCLEKYNYIPPVEKCIKRDALTESDIVIKCVDTHRYKDAHERQAYNSDECILYRRSEAFHKSEVDYFDYRRFLGEDSVIKNDEDFLKLKKYYYKIFECDQLPEATKSEKEACKEKRRNELKMLTVREVSCMELIRAEYIKKLKEEAQWYYWAIDHDPNEYVNLLRAFGDYRTSHFAYAPVWNRKKAYKQVEEEIQQFGKENFCTTNDWKTEIKKLGFKM